MKIFKMFILKSKTLLTCFLRNKPSDIKPISNDIKKTISIYINLLSMWLSYLTWNIKFEKTLKYKF
jgi:hypothetical protein